MEKISVENWNKEREEERNTIDLRRVALEEMGDSKYLNKDELFSLTEAFLNVFGILENWDRRTNLIRLEHFRSMQDDLAVGDEFVGQQ